MTVPQISANLRFNQKKTSGIFTDIAPKIFNESGGTMILRKERRAGLCYILELNRP